MCFRAATAFLGVMLLGSNCQAQPIRWHSDPQAARQEASERRIPLVYDFGAEDCFWCKRLDETTFRDPNVQRAVADRFVMVKVDAQRQTQLTQSLGINSFPTLVFARPDGSYLGKNAGYVDAERFCQQLERAWRESGVEQSTAKQAKQPIFRSSMPETSTPTSEASDESLATQLLYMAKEEYRTGQYLCCLERCRRIQAMHSTTSAAAEARRLSEALQSDPAKTDVLRRTLGESLAAMHVAGAEQAMKAAQWNVAQDHLHAAIRIAPDTASAAVAQTYLNRWRNGEALIRP